MITRKDYMKQGSTTTHSEYFAQFVNDKVKERVTRFMGLENLLSCKDEHLNDIPLKKWDALTGFIFNGSQLVIQPPTLEPVDIKLLREADEGVSPATMVCIYKQAARQVISEHKKA